VAHIGQKYFLLKIKSFASQLSGSFIGLTHKRDKIGHGQN
jgi:hypothetical protein